GGPLPRRRPGDRLRRRHRRALPVRDHARRRRQGGERPGRALARAAHRRRGAGHRRPRAGALAGRQHLDERVAVGGGLVTGRRHQRREAGPVDLHPLPASLRGHVRAAGRGRGGRGRARPPARQGRRGGGRGAPGRDVVGTRGGVVVTVSSTLYLAVAAGLFTIGAFGFLVRRNVLVMFMCVELMLKAVNLTFVTFARDLKDIGGQSLVFFVLVVAAAEVVVGLGVIVSIFRRRSGATADDLHVLKG